MNTLIILRNEKGFTLVEVVASLLLITIILISFIGLLIQSDKSTTTSSSIVDTTYLAQTDMESVYKNSKDKTKKFSDIENSLFEPADGYPLLNTLGSSQTASSDPNYSTIYTFEKTVDEYRCILTIKRRTDKISLTNIIIEVYENTILKSKIENIYTWE